MIRQGTSIVWLSNGGNLVRAAPEHLRYATDMEQAAYNGRNDHLDITRDLDRAHIRKYEDLGPPPTAAERHDAEGNEMPEPVPMHPDDHVFPSGMPGSCFPNPPNPHLSLEAGLP